MRHTPQSSKHSGVLEEGRTLQWVSPSSFLEVRVVIRNAVSILPGYLR